LKNRALSIFISVIANKKRFFMLKTALN